jgi:hypothetical protein
VDKILCKLLPMFWKSNNLSLTEKALKKLQNSLQISVSHLPSCKRFTNVQMENSEDRRRLGLFIHLKKKDESKIL